MTTETLAKKEEGAVIAWQEGKITVTASDVRKYLCPKATDPEIVMFLKTCQSFALNPWVHEAYLVKYKEGEPAAIIIAAEAYLKASETCSEFDGLEAGIILRDSTGKLEFREGAFVADGEEKNLAGGYARVYRKDRQRPFYTAVNIKECQKYTKEGKPTRFWREMPATMVRKVALSRALREAFPTRLGGIYSTAEYEEIPEGRVPPAYEKLNGEKNWKRFWPKVKSELGLTIEQARELLQVGSIKKDLIDAGWSMESIWEALVAALQKQKATEPEPEQIIEGKTDEIITQEEDLFGEREEEAGVAAPAEAETEQPTGAAAPAKPKSDPSSIKTINDLLKACNQDFKMQPKDIYKELGYKSQTDITELPSECYKRIAAVREL